jgi:hypothetical protein
MANTTQSGGISGVTLLGIVFVVLKLTHVIAWSWWWVTAPFWGGLAFVLAIIAIVGVAALIVAGVDSRRAARRRQTTWGG